MMEKVVTRRQRCYASYRHLPYCTVSYKNLRRTSYQERHFEPRYLRPRPTSLHHIICYSKHLHLPRTCLTHIGPLCARSIPGNMATVAAFRSRSTSSIPLFLAPAFATASPHSTRPFSSTPIPASKIGRTPVAVPPEVQINVTPNYKKRSASTVALGRELLTSTVDVTGPLGKLSLTLPPFMSLQADESGRAQKLIVAQPEDRKQRAMWGTYRLCAFTAIGGRAHTYTCLPWLTRLCRDYQGISSKPHPWRL